jgi:SAM-dependent methyltransferase
MEEPAMPISRDAWDKLYSRHGLQYGGLGDIRPLEPFLRPDMIVLDAGCGDGKTTELIAKKCEVVGSDFSREALKSLRLQRPHLEGVNLVECELISMPFESEKFDAVACVHALSHMLKKDRTRGADEMVRVMRPGGVLLVEGFGRGDLRFGEGTRIEEGTYLRGNGIVTHYFEEREIPVCFKTLECLSESCTSKRVSFGAMSGKREVVRVTMRKRLKDQVAPKCPSTPHNLRSESIDA